LKYANRAFNTKRGAMVMQSKSERGSVYGQWRIYEMELWDADYYNSEVKAFIKIGKDGSGEFQFGLVQGGIDGEFGGPPEYRFEFTWAGSDECDEASGSGWLKLTGKNNVEGEIKFHLGDSSKFQARRAK